MGSVERARPPCPPGAAGRGACLFAWTVAVAGDQELAQVDERRAAVVWEGGQIAVLIEAVPAHHAQGANVPTTLLVSGGNVITLTVHHRLGNPAAGGAPFEYPVSAGAGAGWEGGFEARVIELPPAETVPAPAPTCVVPKLRGRAVRAAPRALAHRGCALGTGRGKRSREARIAGQGARSSPPFVRFPRL